MKPAILVALLFRTLDAFRIFDTVYIISNGAEPAPETVSILGYNQLLNRLNLGLGSAVSVLIFICVIADRVRVRQGPRHVWPSSEVSDERQTTRQQLSAGAIAIIVVLVFALIPVLWIVSLSLKTPATVGDGRFIPQRAGRLENYTRIFKQAIFTDALRNSIGIALIATRDRGRARRRWPPTRSRAWTSRARR